MSSLGEGAITLPGTGHPPHTQGPEGILLALHELQGGLACKEARWGGGDTPSNTRA